MSETPRIFVSHSHEDDTFCQRLIADLRARLGEDAVWYDTSGGLHGSDDWWDRIIADITERPFFLVVLSPNAWTSKWVPEEMKIAYRQKVELDKRLIPVRIADSPRREDWASIQEIDFTGYEDPARYALEFAEVLRAIGLNPSIPVGPTPAVLIPIGALPQRRLADSERLAKETHTAYGREHWNDVLDKTDILIEWHAMTPQLWRERASAAYALGNEHTGRDAEEEALRAEPNSVGTLLLQGQRYIREGDDVSATGVLTRAYQLAPLDEASTRLLILEDLTSALARLQRWDDYIRRVTDARRIAPGDSTWLLRQVKGLLSAGQYQEAVSVTSAEGDVLGTDALTQVYEAVPEDQVAVRLAILDQLTTSLARLRRWDEFTHFINEAKRIVPADSQWLLRELDALVREGRYEDALAAAESTNQAQATEALAYMYLHIPPEHTGNRLLILDRLTEALAGLQQWDEFNRYISDARHITPDDPKWPLRQVEDLLKAGRYDEATAAARDLPPGVDLASLLEPWHAAVGAAVRAENWVARSDLLNTAEALGVDRATVTQWRKFDFPHFVPSKVLSSHTESVLNVVWSPDGSRVATASVDRTARIWDAASGKQLAILSHPALVIGLAWSPDGSRLATGSTDRTARIWDTASGRPLNTIFGNAHYVLSVAWSPDGKRLATGRADSTASIWEAASGRLLTTVFNHATWVVSVAWSPDGGRIATISEGNAAQIWEAETGKQLVTLSGHSAPVFSVAWSPDGRRLATAGQDNTARIWEAETGTQLVILSGHSAPIFSVAWSPDGDRLATGSRDKAVCIWEAESGRLLATLSGHSEPVRCVAWAPNGMRLSTASEDKTACIWTED